MKKRRSEFESRPAAIDALGQRLQLASKSVDAWRAGDAALAHLDKDDVDRVARMVDEKRRWLEESAAKLSATPKTTNPPILAAQFLTERTAFDAVVNPILNKPKPKPPKEEKIGEKKEEKTEGEKKAEAEQAPKEEAAAAGANGAKSNGMEVD